MKTLALAVSLLVSVVIVTNAVPGANPQSLMPKHKKADTMQMAQAKPAVETDTVQSPSSPNHGEYQPFKLSQTELTEGLKFHGEGIYWFPFVGEQFAYQLALFKKRHPALEEVMGVSHSPTNTTYSLATGAGVTVSFREKAK